MTDFHNTETPESSEAHSGSDDSVESGTTQVSTSTSSPHPSADSGATLTEDSPPGEIYTRANGSYSANPPRRSRRGNGRPSATSRLGAIDEKSNAIHPDVPLRNPRRALHRVKFFGLGLSDNYSSSSHDLPTYDDVTGPRGEDFADLRANRAHMAKRKSNRKKLACIALVVLVVLGVALGVGLTKKDDHSNRTPPSTPSSPASSGPFPIGTWTIGSSLTTINTSCTANTAAFNCYPYFTYNQSSKASTTSLVWDITSPTISTAALYISSADPTFSYQFQNVPLTLIDSSNLLDEAYTFTNTFTKSVIPQTPITSDGSNAICYFNNTVLSARLFATAAGAGGIGNATAGDAQRTNTGPNVALPWPYAAEFSERVTSQPECYEYVNGNVGSKVDLSGTANGECGCQYQNYAL